MPELSFPWDGVSLGDAAIAPYSAQEFGDIFLRAAIDDNNVSPMQRAHIAINVSGMSALYVSGAATPVNIDGGYVMIAGKTYLLTAATTLAVPTPGANPRLDRIVLRIDYAAQTIRVARLAGTEAAIPSPPALTQTIGTTYEVSLAQVYITIGGVITVRDERLGSFGLSQSVLFRDIAGRALEEFFDNFNAQSAGGTPPPGWGITGVASGTIANNAGVPSSVVISSNAPANSSLALYRGNGVATQYPTELAQAPLLFEWRATPLNAAADAVTRADGRLINAAGTNAVIFGVVGPATGGSTNLILRCVATGTTDFNTGIAIDTSGAYHTFGIWIPSAAGPVVALYDGVAVAACDVAASIPASTVDLQAQFFVGNGTTAAVRAMNIDWARLVRGTA